MPLTSCVTLGQSYTTLCLAHFFRNNSTPPRAVMKRKQASTWETLPPCSGAGVSWQTCLRLPFLRLPRDPPLARSGSVGSDLCHDSTWPQCRAGTRGINLRLQVLTLRLSFLLCLGAVWSWTSHCSAVGLSGLDFKLGCLISVLFCLRGLWEQDERTHSKDCYYEPKP